MRERRVSIIFKLLVFSSLLTGIILNLRKTTSLTAMLSYYTLQSNVLCLAMFIGIIVLIISKKDYRYNNIYYLLKGAVLIAILVTAITYQLALAPNSFSMDIGTTNRYWANMFVHVISPVMVLLDYILFDEKGNFKYYYPIIWLVLPLNYVLYVYTYSARGGRFFNIGGSREFAYFFLDYHQIGVRGVVFSITVIAITILLLSYVLVFLDRKVSKK